MTEQVFVLIKNGVVDNAIVADQQFIDSTADSGLYEQAVDVTTLDPRPGVGATLNSDGTFTPAPTPEPGPAPDPVPVPMDPPVVAVTRAEFEALTSAVEILTVSLLGG